MAQSIYTCVDAQGRRISHDRPIPECQDRGQRELHQNGSTKRNIGPSLSERELERAAQQQRLQTQEQLRATEALRRDQALLTRYHTTADHDADRSEALRQIDAVMATAHQRIAELHRQRDRLDDELAFYPDATMPPSLRKKIDLHAADVSAQRRFMDSQEQEKARINARFDAERVRLQQLWAQRDAHAP